MSNFTEAMNKVFELTSIELKLMAFVGVVFCLFVCFNLVRNQFSFVYLQNPLNRPEEENDF